MSKSERGEKDTLEEFGKICAKRPLNLDEVAKQRENMRKLGGEGLFIEACAIVANYVIVTRTADCTGLFFPPKDKAFLPIVKFIANVRLFFRCDWMRR